MQTRGTPFRFGDSVLNDIGHTFMNVARSGVGLLTQVRGDASNQVVAGASAPNYANLAVYGTLAALALLIVVKPNGRKA